MHVRVAEPALNLVGLTMTHLAEYRKHSGVRSEIVEIIAVHALDPAAITLGRPGITHTDSHGSTQTTPENNTARTARSRDPSGPYSAFGFKE
jgi:hypothetical protein